MQEFALTEAGGRGSQLRNLQRTKEAWCSWEDLVSPVTTGGRGQRGLGVVAGRTVDHSPTPGHHVLFMGDPEASFTLIWSCLGTENRTCKGSLW